MLLGFGACEKGLVSLCGQYAGRVCMAQWRCLDVLGAVLVVVVETLLRCRTLYPTAEAEHQAKGGLLLDVVVRQRTAVFQLLAGKDQAITR